ncbi:MAG: efflux transporter periplasmic adaptor subunit [Acidobacteria bacterium]|nr:MAG: efflux transporter periplasmic adaptor subunit [Acidobacteriota bacterium]
MNTENRYTETEPANHPHPNPLPNTEEGEDAGASSPNMLAQSQPKASRRSRYAVIAGVALVIVAGLALGVIPRLRAQSKLVAATQEVTLRTVTVTNATRLASSVQLALPGDVRAFEETKIYARADGYLLKWNSDIGAKVEAGQVLAEIDTPELDQELNQSRAALAQAQANLVLARSSAERWQRLLKDRAVSQQEVDEKTSALAAREADVKAAEAAVARLEKLSSFKEVRAPFAGTITRRHVDTGALIRAGGNASALFDLAQTDTLRVQVNVPQAYLRDIAIGSTVAIAVAEYPGRAFPGKVLRTSGAFDATTRTMLTEIEVPNRNGELFPGIHVDVQLTLAQANPPIVVPARAVIIRGEGLQVAEVDDANAIRLQKVQAGRDLGRTVEIVSGLSDGARIVTNPTDTLVEGMLVRIAGTQTASAKANQIAKR